MSSTRRTGPAAVTWMCVIVIGCTEAGNAPLEPGSPNGPSSLDWPSNEPAGATPISDQPWDALASLGWVHSTAGKSRIVVDSGPASPGHAIEFPFDIGDSAGMAGVDWHPLAGPRRVYARIWWKPSSPWQGHSSNVNQIAQVHALNTDGQMYLTLYGPPGGPYELRMLPQFSGVPGGGWLVPNRNSVAVALGAWHKVEWMIDYQGNAGAGTVRWWLDGELIGDYNDVPFPDQGLDAFGLTPYWGGSGEAKTENDWFRFDHSYLSGPWTDATPGWPHEPTGFSSLTDFGFDDVIPAGEQDTPIASSGWWTVFNGAGQVTRGTQGSAPRSPSYVAEFRYPIGFQAGSAPGTLFHPISPAKKEVFVGIWWKPSDPWQGHPSNVNKIMFLFPHGGGDMYLTMYGPPGGPYRLRSIPQFPGLASDWRLSNVDSTPVALGAWHRVEWYIKYATLPLGSDGVVKWWLDGVLQGEHHDLQTPADTGFETLKLSPTWGGAEQVSKTEEDFFWFDHVYMSAP